MFSDTEIEIGVARIYSRAFEVSWEELKDFTYGLSPGWDSLKQIQICLDIEDFFGIEMDEDFLQNAVTLKSTIDLVKSRIQV